MKPVGTKIKILKDSKFIVLDKFDDIIYEGETDNFVISITEILENIDEIIIEPMYDIIY
jgi:hypothetical protein